MDQRGQQNRKTFFSPQNEEMLFSMLSNNFSQRLGTKLNEKQTTRLERGLEHYMGEVFQANSSLPVQVLNKEALASTASDFNDYLQRQESVARASPQAFQETSQRYDQLQLDRQRSMEAPRPAIPDYVQPLIIKEEDSVSALSLFEEAKKRRNLEVTAQAEEQVAKRNAASMKPIYLQEKEAPPDPRSIYDMPLDLVVAGQRDLSGRADTNPTIARPGPSIASRGVLQQDMIIKQEDIQSYKEIEYNLSLYSADRNWEIDTNNGQNRFNFSVNLNSNNSPVGISLMPNSSNRLKNIVRIEFVKAIVPIENTDIVVRKTTSTNSPDFLQAMLNAEAIAIATVNAGNSIVPPFPAANNSQANYQTLVNRNNLLTNATCKYDTTYVKNVYGFPFISLNVEELDTNTFGTSNSTDNAFGILQYDSSWTDNTDSLGFTSLIPKHMKCQRIYSPTPLSTLNKLTVRLQRPNGTLVNSAPDTLDISGIFLSHYTSMRQYFNGPIDISGTGYSDPAGEYIWIDCAKWFSKYQISIGDRIQIKNLTSFVTTPAITDLIDYLQNTDGLIVAGLAFSRPITAAELLATGLTANQVTNGINNTVATSVLIDGSNNVGYSRFIIVRGKFNDPSTGSTTVSPYGKQIDNSVVSLNMLGVSSYGGSQITPSPKIVPGRLINLSRQTQLIFRVVTREYDSTSLVRPDNL